MNPTLLRQLGDTSLHVSQMGFGGAGIGSIFSKVGQAQADKAVQRAFDAGVRYFDTAPLYGYGLSEVRLGHALKNIPRDQVTLSTKVGYTLIPRAADDSTARTDFADSLPFTHIFDYSREAVLRSLEGSLERLGTDHVDIVLIHDPDESTSIDFSRDPYEKNHFREALDGAYPTLHELRAQGVIRAIGVGMNQCPMLCDFAREGEFDCFLLAGRYTLLNQDALTELLPLCVEKHISILIGSPFQSGILATGAVPNAKYNYVTAPPEILERVRQIQNVCAAFNVSLQAAALQFPFGHPAVASVMPGAGSADEATANLAFFQEQIQTTFWDELKRAGLLAVNAPLPV